MSFKYIVADIEANDLYEGVTQIWTLSAIDMESDEVVTFSQLDGPNWHKEAIKFLTQAEMHCWHNGYGYDYWVMNKLWGTDWSIRPDMFNGNKNLKIFDTFILSQLNNPDRYVDKSAEEVIEGVTKKKKIGKHSVESYAVEEDDEKVIIHRWDEFSQDIIDRGEKDVILQKNIFLRLLREMKLDWRELVEGNTSKKAIFDFHKAVDLEHKFAYIFANQEHRDGCWVDKETCQETIEEFEQDLKELKLDLEQKLPYTCIPAETKVKGEYKHVGKLTKKDGSYQSNVTKWFLREGTLEVAEGAKKVDGTKTIRKYYYGPPRACEDLVEGPFSRVHWRLFDVDSNEGVKDYLLSIGWVPTEYNDKNVTEKESRDPKSPYYKQVPKKPARVNGQKVQGSPKLTEDSFDSIEGDLGIRIAEYRQKKHRVSFLKGMLRNMNPRTGMIHQGGVTNGAVSGRVAHRGIVNVPNPGRKFADRVRRSFVSKDPYICIGADISGLEDRSKAHYAYTFPNGKAYAEKILDPTYSVHDENSAAWGVPRSVAKPGGFALQYNCGIGGLQAALGCSRKQAEKYYNAYWEVNKPYQLFDKQCKAQFKKYKYLVGLDGRRLKPRSAHAASNAMCQSAGNIIAKTATCLQENYKHKFNIDGWQWSQTHDENQWMIHRKHIDNFYEMPLSSKDKAMDKWREYVIKGDYHYSKPTVVGDKILVVKSEWCHLLIQSYRKAGEYWGLNVPVTGEVMAGYNFAQVH